MIFGRLRSIRLTFNLIIIVSITSNIVNEIIFLLGKRKMLVQAKKRKVKDEL